MTLRLSNIRLEFDALGLFSQAKISEGLATFDDCTEMPKLRYANGEPQWASRMMITSRCAVRFPDVIGTLVGLPMSPELEIFARFIVF